MRHAKKKKKLIGDASHRDAVLKGLAAQVFAHEKIKTTERRAKEVRRLVEKVVTLAKQGDVHARRQAIAVLGDKELVHKVFEEVPSRFEEREGGYTRILKVGSRQGDGAPVVVIELV